MGGESSAFRAVVTNSSSSREAAERNERIDRVDSITKQPERKPSAFRMISQLVGDDSPSIIKSSSPTYEQQRHETNVRSVIESESANNKEFERVEVEEEDEEIDVQDSDQDVASSPTVAWRDHWTEQQPLELTKHDRWNRSNSKLNGTIEEIVLALETFKVTMSFAWNFLPPNIVI